MDIQTEVSMENGHKTPHLQTFQSASMHLSTPFFWNSLVEFGFNKCGARNASVLRASLEA